MVSSKYYVLMLKAFIKPLSTVSRTLHILSLRMVFLNSLLPWIEIIFPWMCFFNHLQLAISNPWHLKLQFSFSYPKIMARGKTVHWASHLSHCHNLWYFRQSPNFSSSLPNWVLYFNLHYKEEKQALHMCLQVMVGKVSIQAKWPIRLELNLVTVAWSEYM